jgi:hypothetical protein
MDCEFEKLRQAIDLRKQNICAEKEKTRQMFARYAEKADFDRFDQILARVPDVDPVPGDELL